MKSFWKNFHSYLLVLLATNSRFVAASQQWYTIKDGTKLLIETDAKYNFLQAADECARRELQLVILDNAEKNTALVELVESFSEKPISLWIGLDDEFNTATDLNRSFYSFSTGKQNTFSSWRANEPNNMDGNEHCVEMVGNSGYKWNDISCTDTKHGYVCEQHYLTTLHNKNMDLRRDLTNFTLTNTINDFQIQIKLIQDINANNRKNIIYLLSMWQNSVEVITNDQADASFVKVTAAALQAIADAQISAEHAIDRIMNEHSTRLESDLTFIDGVLSHN